MFAAEISTLTKPCVAVLVIGVLLVIEHRLVKPDDLKHVHIAFFHINSILSVVLLAGIFIDVWIS